MIACWLMKQVGLRQEASPIALGLQPGLIVTRRPTAANELQEVLTAAVALKKPKRQPASIIESSTTLLQAKQHPSSQPNQPLDPVARMRQGI